MQDKYYNLFIVNIIYGENMKKNTLTVTILISLIIVFIYTLASTYAVIINVISKEGINEIVNEINIRDLMTQDDGSYNNTYYNVINELNITANEANILMESIPLNESLQTILQTIVDYKVANNLNAKLSNQELYNIIVTSINKDNTISKELKDKVITKSNTYIQDVSDFIYDIDVSILENT